MNKSDARVWYNYTFTGNKYIIEFEDYYKTYEEWFDKNILDYKCYLAPIEETQVDSVPCQEGNNPMYIEDMVCTHPVKKCPNASAASVIQVVTEAKPDTATDQRKYLAARAHDIRYAKFEELRDMFFINEPAGPKSVAELKERLKKGLFTIEKQKYSDYEDDEEHDNFYWRDAFSWRTPETQKDEKSHNAAYKELMKFYEDIIDQIKILEPKEGLALLDDLKKWKPSKAKK